MTKQSLERLIAALPPFYLERTRLLPANSVEASHESERKSQAVSDGYVLYWMATAQRLAENPALDVAWLLANEWQQPCLIYQGLTQRYRWASDRHHAFLLQSARELQSRAAEYGLDYVLEVESGRGTRSTRLKDLADAASVVVVEDFPCSPQRDLLKALRRATRTPIIAVDTACLVPPKLVGRAITRAFEFRSATKKLYATRVPAPYPQDAKRPKRRLISPPSSNVDLQQVQLSEIIAACDIDHSVPPVIKALVEVLQAMNVGTDFDKRG